MCPQCDKYCDYWYLEDSCDFSRIAYVFDNYSTVFFAVFMSCWGKYYKQEPSINDVTHLGGMGDFPKGDFTP